MAAVAIHNKTMASSVYERLRHDILRLAFQPGERLGVEALAGRYDVGATPLREALNRLSADGLVTLSDNRGFRVAEVSLEALKELTYTRCAVNGLALREAIEKGDQQWEEGIVLAYHRLSKAKPQLDVEQPESDLNWSLLHREFHASLIAGCRLRWLITVCEWLFDQADRYRYIEFQAKSRRPDVEIEARAGDDEHRAIMDATLERNADEAVRLLQEHFHRTEKLAILSGLIQPEIRETKKP